VHNLRKMIPSLVSTRGYGLLFDAYSAVTFTDGKDGGSLAFDVIDDLDYYFIAGPDMDGAVAGYRQLTGAAVMLPRWAYGYVQSKERYKSQDEVVATVKEFRDRKIPLDVIVQDWNYWYPGQWGSDPDPKYFPDIAKMVKDVHDMDAHIIISIWPNPSAGSTAGKALKEAGFTLAGTTFVNMFDPKSRELYWKLVAWKNFGQYGMDGWWCDSTEPETGDWGVKRPANADEVNIQALAKVVDSQFLNAYGMEDSKGIFKNQRKALPDRRVFNITRAGYAGTQRYGAVLWTGDISASWSTLEKQVAEVQSFSAAGNPYIHCDTGAFFVRKGKQWFWQGQYDQGVADLGYRELYTRWLQFEAFLPMFRSHGTDTPREPWRFGDPGTPYYDAIVATIHLRYRLLPYLYSLGGQVATQNAMFLRPVAFAFPNDPKTHDLKAQFLVGSELMAAPVLQPMEYGPNSEPVKAAAKTVDVYLPEGSAWVDFWTGKTEAGGRTIRADAPISHSPLFVKAGSILPLGPRVQYANEQPGAPIELRIYPGADGVFTLYEDEGDNYNYEKGKYTTIPISWDEAKNTLTIGKRSGNFPGMLKERTFHVVLVRLGFGVGIAPEPNPDAISHYVGKTMTLSLGKK
jgi:alpha-D-xyloside xylohydrolase